MVELKFSALYTDNLGCEQSTVYFSNEEFQLKVRGCTFRSENLGFDFYVKNSTNVNRMFYMKDDELIEYVLDIRMPLLLTYNNRECVEEFLLRIERHKNYYNNSLSFYLQDTCLTVEGYDLEELLTNMGRKLPKEYSMKCNLSCIFGAYYLEAKKKNIVYSLEEFREDLKINTNKNLYLELFSNEDKKDLKKLQKFPITYICDEYCLS